LIDRYEVLRKIGQGGMSAVYEAYDEARDENVALKVLLPELACRPRMQDRFLQEGRLSSSFSHPNIARVYDLHQTETVTMISMELLHGCNLRHDIERRAGQRQKYLPIEVLKLIEQVSDALSVVHAASVIHRDLKPENLWSCLNESIKIMDFGIARESTGNVFTTGPRGSGTPYYIAPEQLNASPLLDHRADQYSLAVIAYEMLTGVIPQGAIVPPHHKVTGIPKKLSMAVFRALNADPNQRFPHVRGFAEAAKFRTGMSPWTRAAMIFGGTLAIGGVAAGYQLKIAPMLNVKPSPVWASISPATVVEKNEVTIDCRATDSTLENNQLSFKLLADAPEGAIIDPMAGRIKWTPTEAQGPKDFSFQVMAVVQQPGFPQRLEEKTVKISVKETIDPPVFDVPESGEAKEHLPFEIVILARDVNTPPIPLNFELINGPRDMEIDSRTGKIVWTPGEKDGGSVNDVVVRVSPAGEGNQAAAVERKFKVRVEESIDAPTFISASQMRGEVGKPAEFRVIARDTNDPPLNLYYRLRNGDRAGLTIDPINGLLSWTPEQDQSGKEFDVTVEALFDINGQTKRAGEQTIRVAVEKFDPPKSEDDSAKKSTSEDNVVNAPNNVPSDIGLGAAGDALGGAGTCPSGAGGGSSNNIPTNGNNAGRATCPNNPGNNGGPNGNGGGNGSGGRNGSCNGNGPSKPNNATNGDSNTGNQSILPKLGIPKFELPNGTVLPLPTQVNEKLQKIQPFIPMGTLNSIPKTTTNTNNAVRNSNSSGNRNVSGGSNQQQNKPSQTDREKIENAVGNILKQLNNGRR
jgi:serine/threonine protein kinase